MYSLQKRQSVAVGSEADLLQSMDSVTNCVTDSAIISDAGPRRHATVLVGYMRVFKADGSHGVRRRVAMAGLFMALVMAHAAGVQPVLSQSAPDSSVIENSDRLPVTINGREYALDTLIVRRSGTDKLPVALITHGSSVEGPHAATVEWLRGWAHDLAHRGWLAVAVMRRGYGKSDGEAANDAGTCAAPDVGRYLDAHADDLEAALRSIAKRPDADVGRVIAIGDSAGGAAVMALAARPSARLSAVINVSGGLSRRLGPFRPNPACAPYDADLVWNFARFGSTAHVPTLWLYAENDSWFRPGLVERMRAAFTGSGGKAELVMLPPFQGDGHTLFFAPGGKQLLLPELDAFLRANELPTWDMAALAPLLARLSPEDRQGVETYLRVPTEKALVLGPNAGTYWQYGERTLEDARTKALANCKEKTKTDCSLAADNFHPVPQRMPDEKPDH